MNDQKRRKLLIGAVGLVKGSVRNGGKAMVATCDDLEQQLDRTGFLINAPFEVISLILRYGTKWGDPEVGRINRAHSELEVAVEVPMAEIRMLELAELTKVVKTVTLQALVAVASKYGLDGEVWKSQIPSN